MDLQLSNKVAIVTGASRGIGRAIAETLSAEGMRVVLAARSGALLEEVAAGCPSETAVFAADLREPEAPARLAAFAVRRFGGIDLVVNNAGATKRGDFIELTEEEWQDGFALKFYGAVRCCRAAWPQLVARRGAVVNIVGVGGRTGHAEFAIGGAVNAALLNFTKVLSERGIKEGVRVNAVNPGAIATGRLTTRIRTLAGQLSVSEEEATRHMAAKLGIDRFGKPDEIARAVAFLASPACGFCQGSILDVDGGETRTL